MQIRPTIISITLFLFSFLMAAPAASAQGFRQDPLYWKNRPPYKGYWQQDVLYQMKAVLDDSVGAIRCDDYKLTYWNNSPNELKELYFRLPPNAFIPGSHYSDLHKNNDSKVVYGKNEALGLGLVVQEISVNGEKALAETDNTIMKVPLAQPLKSGDSLVVSMKFVSYFDQGSMRRRMKVYEKWGHKHFNAVQWYPSVAVYDRKCAWTTEQDLDKEYYSDFGNFEMELSLPEHYIVEATGLLTNENDCLPKELKEKLNLFNFANKPWGEKPSEIIKPGKLLKTWKYKAENVHNFAFTASPTYRIGELDVMGKKVIALAHEPNASKWQMSAQYAAGVMMAYGHNVGSYHWPKLVVADAAEGTETPMMALCTGGFPQHQSLLAHEISHQWFYGMIGSNETYRAFLDEGFAQYLTVWLMDKAIGKSIPYPYKNRAIAKNVLPYSNAYQTINYPLMTSLWDGYDMPLNTHSSGFRGGVRQTGGYALAYFKGAAMLANLKYVLGDEQFGKALRHYFDKWKFCHPYPEDFREAVTESAQTDLAWFFDQWFETDKKIDYAIGKIKNLGKNEYEFVFKRKGEMQMPIDFTVTGKSGQTYKYHIPNTWYLKKTEAKVLPKWYGFGPKLHPEYKTQLSFPEKIKSIEIDPAHAMADVDLSNNKKGGKPLFVMDYPVKDIDDWMNVKNRLRPDVWYNSVDGLQMGARARGGYFNRKNLYDAALWYNSGLLRTYKNDDLRDWSRRFSFDVSYQTRLFKKYALNDGKVELSYLNGLWNGSVSYQKIFKKQDPQQNRYGVFTAKTGFLQRDEASNRYLMAPQLWSPGGLSNSYTDFSFAGHFKGGWDEGFWQAKLRLRGIIPASQGTSYIELLRRTDKKQGKTLFKSRLFGRLALEANAPRESALYLASGNPENMAGDKYYRAAGFFPAAWQGVSGVFGGAHFGGGLNQRAWANNSALSANGTAFMLGASGVSANVEMEFQEWFGLKTRKISPWMGLKTYAFAGAAAMGQARFASGAFFAEAGLGAAFSLKFGPNWDIKPLTIRADFPLLSASSIGRASFGAIPFVVGVGRAF